jgi:phage N-6-adenine-methyltransferase
MSPSRDLFTSVRQDWRTPKAVYEGLDAEFDFEFDPCPSGATFDGLKVPWGKSSFVNPPYGRAMGAWVEKAIAEAAIGKLVVFLLPSRTDTIWWHRLMECASEIRFIKGRLRFDDGGGKATFPSAVIVIDGRVS